MISLDQMAVLTGAQLPHGGRAATSPDHVAVIGHRLAVKLNQTTSAALAQMKGHALIILYFLRIRDVLGRSRSRC